MRVINHLENYLEGAPWSEDEPGPKDKLKPVGKSPDHHIQTDQPLQKGKGAIN